MSLYRRELEEILRSAGVDKFFHFPPEEFHVYKQQAIELTKMNQTSALLTDVGSHTPTIALTDFSSSPYVVDVYLVETSNGNSMLSIYSPNISSKPENKEVVV